MKKRIAMIIFLILCFAFSSQAVNTMTWTGAKNHAFNDPCNWDKAYDPCQANYASIDATANDPCITADTNTFQEVDLGNTSSSVASLTITNNAKLKLVPGTASSAGFLGVGNTADTNAYLKMTSGGIEGGYRIYLSNVAGSYSKFDMTGGTIHISGRLRQGHGYGGPHKGSIFNMSGGTIAMTDNPTYCEYMTVGWGQNLPGCPSVFNFSGGTINIDAFVITRNGDGIFNMSGGTLNCLNDKACIYLGEHGENTTGKAIWNMSGGTVEVGTYVGVGFKAGDEIPDINMTGGTIDTSTLQVGMAGEGVVNLRGGTITVNYLDDFSPGLTFFGKSILNVENTGELIWIGRDAISIIDANIASGNIVAYNGSGRVLRTYDGDTHIKADNTAHWPIPDVNAVAVNPSISTLSWTNPYPGETVYCDVYFGTNRDTNSNPKIVDHQAVSSVAVTLDPNQKYYWRVDTDSVAHPTKVTGMDWYFTTNNIGAQDPNPPDGATGVSKKQVLSWTMVGGPFATVDIYLDTNSTPCKVATQSAAITSYDPNPDLLYDEHYRWRIDATDTNGVTYRGFPWEFWTLNPSCLITASDGDLDGDCKVTFADFAIMAESWLVCAWSPQEACE